MLNKETFIRGIQLINAILSESHQIEGSSIDVYYLLLQDFADKEYMDGITRMLKIEDLRFGAPSPAIIIKYIQEVNGSRQTAKKIADLIKNDILLYGENMPKYKEEILKAINNIGGWDSLRRMNEEDFSMLAKEIEAVVKEAGSNLLLANNFKYLPNEQT